MPVNKVAPAPTGARKLNTPTARSYAPVPSPAINHPDRPAWTAAKNAGDEGEQRVADLLRALGLLVEQVRGFARYDLSVTGRIEVKRDLQAERTANVAVEISSRGKQSGIRISTATGWAFLVGREVLLLPTAALRKLVRRGGYRMAQAGENAVVVLVPLADLRHVARSILIDQGGRR